MSVQEIIEELPKLTEADLKLLREKVDELEASKQTPKTSWGKSLMKYAGASSDLPSDMAVNHDHYLYGTARQQ